MPFAKCYLYGPIAQLVERSHGMGEVRSSSLLGSTMKTKKVKLVVFVPITHADMLRNALGEAGAGRIGNYDFCSFSSRGVGRFRGNEKTNPTVGTAEKYEAVDEERIEVVVSRTILKRVIMKMKNVHPYEEVAFDVYPLENL